MTHISPRQLARAAGVSESSVKRWCDQGRIELIKTAGGHRRLTLQSATEFLRAIGSDVSPGVLGLPARRGRGGQPQRDLVEHFERALIDGDESVCRQVLFDLHLAGVRVSRVFDTVVASAFQRLGGGWECGDVEVYQERRGCGLCLRVLDELRAVIPAAKANAPLAIGGTPEADLYMLPTTMVEIVLRQGGWRSQSLGSCLPFSTLASAIRDYRPALFWLSISHLEDESRFVAQYQDFYEQVQTLTAVVVGGRALTEPLRRQLRYAAFCDNLEHLDAFAKTLKRSLGRDQAQPSSVAGGKTFRKHATNSTEKKHDVDRSDD